MPRSYIQGHNAALFGHQVLHLSSAPDSIQPHDARLASHGAQAPQRIIETVAVQDRAQVQRLVVRGGLAQGTQELAQPAVNTVFWPEPARPVLADFVQGGLHVSPRRLMQQYRPCRAIRDWLSLLLCGGQSGLLMFAT